MFRLRVIVTVTNASFGVLRTGACGGGGAAATDAGADVVDGYGLIIIEIPSAEVNTHTGLVSSDRGDDKCLVPEGKGRGARR